MSDTGRREAFVTLATNDTYSLGCLVLGNSLRKVQTVAQLVVMVTNGVSNSMRSQLAQVFDVIQEVNVLDSNDPINLSLLGRPDLNVTFTKLHCWRLTQFDKAVFLDADTLVLQNVDELFDREELSAAPDAGWPDCFNSGVFVFKPSLETYESLLQFATSQGSFDGGDQGLLNMYFNKWATEDISKHLPFIYNVVSQAFYSYLPAFTQFKEQVKIVHFIGAVKPWHHTFDTNSRKVTPLPGTGHSQEFLQVWWNIFMDTVQPSLDPTLRDELTRTLYTPWPPPVQQQNKRENQSCENADNRPLVEETVPVMFPYNPPEVDQSIILGNTVKNIEDNNITEITVIARSYSELESHYAEEPISHINPCNPPPGIYTAPSIMEGWEKGTKGLDPDPPDFTIPHNTSVESKLEAFNINSEQESKAISINKTRENKHAPYSPEENSIGLVGELAAMTIQGSPPQTTPVSDAQRKLNWEKGQIDYLGQDSFENIQRKIDETLRNTDDVKAPVGIDTPFNTKNVSDQEQSASKQSNESSRLSQPVKQDASIKSTTQPKVMSSVKPPVSIKPSGSTSEGTKPSVLPQVGAMPIAQAPVGARSSAPEPVGVKPTMPGPISAKPIVPGPVDAKPTVQGPLGAKPTVPVGAKPTVPVSAKPTVPVGAKPTMPGPVSAKPTVPVGAKPTMPGPVGAKPTMPAPVSAKPAVPAPVAARPGVGPKPSGPGPLGAKPSVPVPGQSRFGAPLRATSARGPAPTQPKPSAASASQSSSKTSSFNIQPSSYKK